MEVVPNVGLKRCERQEKMASTEPMQSLAIEGPVEKLAGIGSLQPSVQKQLKNVKWVRSYDFHAKFWQAQQWRILLRES